MTSRALTLFAGIGLVLGAPLAAQAREYGKFGTVEIGGSFAASQTTIDFDDDASDGTVLAGTVQPSVGLFVLPGFQVFTALDLAYAQTNPESGGSVTSQTLGAALGGAVLIGFGRARLGPSLAVRYVQETVKPENGDAVDVRVGPGAEIAGVAKLQVGSGGIVSIAVFASHDLLENEDDSFTRTAVGTRGGFSIYF